TPIEVLSLMAISWLINPMEENTSVLLPSSGTSIEYLPSKSVSVPISEFLTVTSTPGIGIPLISYTSPVIVLVSANNCLLPSTQRKDKKINFNYFMVLVLKYRFFDF